MSFFDDIGSALDNLFGFEKPNNSFNGVGEDQWISPDGIGPSNTAMPVIGTRDPRAQDYDKLAGIIQNRSPAFSVIDVTPYQLSSTNFQPTISQRILTDKFGYDGEAENEAAGVVTTRSAWRTVPITQSGTSLRIDFLPSKINDYLGSVNTAGANDLYLKPDMSGGTDANKGGNASAFKFSQRHATSFVLVQFDDPNGPILIAKHGTVFECTFERVFITTRVLTARFSAIVGSNARIVDANTQSLIAARPAYGPGLGIWEPGIRHCVPFCLVLDSTGIVSVTPNGLAFGMLANTNTTFTLITGANSNVPNGPFIATPGICVGWITELAVCATAQGAGSSQAADISLLIASVTGGGTTLNKLLANIPIIISAPVGTSIAPPVQDRIVFTEPQRFSLIGGANEALVLRIINTNSPTSFKVSVHGYIYGSGVSQGTTGTAPITGAFLTSAPFPDDLTHLTNNF